MVRKRERFGWRPELLAILFAWIIFSVYLIEVTPNGWARLGVILLVWSLGFAFIVFYLLEKQTRK